MSQVGNLPKCVQQPGNVNNMGKNKNKNKNKSTNNVKPQPEIDNANEAKVVELPSDDENEEPKKPAVKGLRTFKNDILYSPRWP